MHDFKVRYMRTPAPNMLSLICKTLLRPLERLIC